jgi:thiol-disulfide isomerase/thioredoxin
VINFWATWCAPCVKEIPNFEKLNTTYKASPLKVILVSLDFKSKLEKVVYSVCEEKQY